MPDLHIVQPDEGGYAFERITVVDSEGRIVCMVTNALEIHDAVGLALRITGDCPHTGGGDDDCDCYRQGYEDGYNADRKHGPSHF